jgi:outer membrane biosynthesis protein TonB
VRKSAVISIALHLAILLYAVVAFPTGRALDAPKIADVPIDIVSPSEFTKIKAGMADAKDDAPLAPKPEAPKPKAVTEKEAPKPPKAEAVPPPPPAPQEKAEDKPTPKPDKVEQPKEAEAKKEAPPKKAEAKPEKPKAKPKPKPVAEKKKRDVNVDRMAALLNKLPDAAMEASSDDATPEPPRKKVRGQTSGTKATMAVNEIDALRAKIAQCWNPPPGGLGADAIVVKLRLQLNEDGSLIGYPTVANSGGSAFFQAAADSAVRAVYQCQPYELPSEKYAVWRDMILNFDPRQMYGSG